MLRRFFIITLKYINFTCNRIVKKVPRKQGRGLGSMMIIFIKHANRHKISTWILDVTFFQAIRGLEPPRIFVELRYFYLSAPIILSASNVFCHLDDDGQVSFVFFRLISIEFAWVCPPEVHRHCDLVLQMFQCIYNHRYWPRLSHLYEKGKTFILESSFCYIKGYHDFPDMYPEFHCGTLYQKSNFCPKSRFECLLAYSLRKLF